MAKELSKSGISTGQDILAGQITQSVDALTGTEAYDITISGSLTITGSTFIQPANSNTGTNVLTVDSDGKIYKTGSYNTGGGGGGSVGTLQQVTDLGKTTTNVITSSGLLIDNGTDISPSPSASGQLSIQGLNYSGYITLDGTGMYIGNNSISRKLVFQTNEEDKLSILTDGNISSSGGQFITNFIGNTSTTRIVFGDNTPGNEATDIAMVTDSSGEIIMYPGKDVAQFGNTFIDLKNPTTISSSLTITGSTNILSSDVTINDGGYFDNKNSSGIQVLRIGQAGVNGGEMILSDNSGTAKIVLTPTTANFKTNITASGNISSSGDIFFNPTNANTGTSVLTIDPTTGKVFRTGSYNTGGGSGGDINVGKMYYVDSVNGDDTTGTGGVFNKPYLTISEALNVAESGDTVFIRPGTYDEEQLNLPSGISLIGENYQDVKIGPSTGTYPVLRVSSGSCYINNITFVPNPSDPTKPGLNISIPSNENLNIGTIGIEGDGSTGGGVGIMKSNLGSVTFESIYVLKGGLSSVIEVKNGKLSSNLNNFPSSSGAVTNFAYANNDGVKYPCIQLENLNIDTNQLTNAIKSNGSATNYINKVTLISPSIKGVTNVLDVQGNHETIESIGGEFTDVTYALSSSATGDGNDAKYRITSQHLPVYSYTPELAYNAEFAFDFLSQKSDLFKSSKNLFGVDQMSVGVAEKNIESYFGKGAPYQTGMVVFNTSGSAITGSESTGSNITNVTTEARSTDNSFFKFQTTGSGDTILFCTQRRSDSSIGFEPLQTFGVTLDVLQNTNALDNYVLEVRGEDIIGAGPDTQARWFEVPFQCYSNDLGYVYGDQTFKREQSKETLIFGIDASVNWVTSSIIPISSSGTAIPPASQQPVNGYWARFRQIDSVDSIGNVPRFESMRITSDAVAISDKGIQFQGQTIYQDVQPLGILKYDDPQNTIDLTLGSNPSFDLRLPDGGLVEDGVTTPFTLPAGICTAYPIEIEYDVLKDTSGDNTINLKSTINEIAFNFIPTGSNKIPAQRSINNTSEVTSPQTITGSFIASSSYENKIFKVTQSIDVSTLYSGDIVITNFDAVSENNLAVVNARAKFLRYALGEYRNPAQPFTPGIIPGPPVTIMEEDFSNGYEGGDGVKSPGWIQDNSIGNDTQWVIAGPGELPTTASSAVDPVDRGRGNTFGCYITNSSGSGNAYEYDINVNCKIYAKFDVPTGVQNLQITASFKSKGENEGTYYDWGGITIISTDNVTPSELVDKDEDGGTSLGGVFSPSSAWVTNLANSGKMGDEDNDGHDGDTVVHGEVFAEQKVAVNSTQWEAGKENIICFNWSADFGTQDQPPLSISYIKIMGTYT